MVLNTTINTTLNLTANETLNYTQLYIENTQTIKNLNLLLGILTIITILTFVYFYIYKAKKLGLKKNIKENKQTIEEMKNLIKKLDEYTITHDKEGKTLKIKEIHIKNVPKEIIEPLFEDNGFLKKIMKIQDKGKRFRDYPLLLLKNDGTIEIKDGVKSGLYIFKTKEMRVLDGEIEVQKAIDLAPQKLRKLKNGDKDLLVWIANEDEAEAYPIEPKHHSKSMYKIIESILLTRQARDTGLGKKLPKILIILAIIAVLGGVVYWYISSQKKLPPTEIITNITQNVTSNVTKVITI